MLSTVSSSYIVFFLMTRPPPRPTLFPYTTLFRSAERGRGTAARKLRAEHQAAVQGHVHAGAEEVGHPRAGRDGADGLRDRKSTRLNSSHVEISYAVFCLKKKKRKIETNARAITRT